MTTTTLSKTAKKYLAIIEAGHIEEGEIISLKSFLNKSEENGRIIFDAMSEKDLTISESQNKKGFDFLLSQWKTPTGKERINNPFGYREQRILDNFSHFTVKDWYNAGNAYVDYFLPVYSCHAKDGCCFDYYYNGKVNIIG